MKKMTLPAVEVEVPRMGTIVYVSPRVGWQFEKGFGKATCMFTAEVVVDGNIELQSFHLKCLSKREAESTIQNYQKQLADVGPFPFIQHSA